MEFLNFASSLFMLVNKNKGLLARYTVKNNAFFILLVLIIVGTPAIAVPQDIEAIPDTLDEAIVSIDTMASNDALEFPVFYNAEDSIVARWDEEKIYMYGKAHVTYNTINLDAEIIEYDMKTGRVKAFGKTDSTGTYVGKPIFKEEQEEFVADTMIYDFKNKWGKIYNVRTQVSEGYIDGKLVATDAENTVYVKDGRYCPCEDPDAKTKFRVTKIKVMDSLIVSGPGYLELAGVPTPLVFPFAYFPNQKDRNAGIIIPTFGGGPVLGIGLLNGGYFWPVNDNLNLSFLGDIYSRGSYALKTQSDYKKRYKYNGNLSLEFFNNQYSEPEFPDFSRTREFWIKFNHRQDAKAHPKNNFSAVINAGTSGNFRNNINTSAADYLSNTFNSNIKFSRSIDLGNTGSLLNLSANHDQNTNTGAFNVTLPSASYSINRFYPFRALSKDKVGKRKFYENIGMTYGVSGANRLNTNDSLISMDNLENLLDDMQYGVKHNAVLNTSLKAWKSRININPSASYNGRMEFQTITRYWDTNQEKLVTDTNNIIKLNHDLNFSLNTSTRIYGFYSFKRGKVSKLRHILSPSANFSYRPKTNRLLDVRNQNDSLLQQYSEFDNSFYRRPGGTQESGLFSFSLVNSFDAKLRKRDTATGENIKIKLIDNFTIRSAYDIAKDSVNWNDLSLNLNTVLFKYWTINARASFDPYSYDSSGRKTNTFLYEENGNLFKMRNANIGSGLRLQSKNRIGQSNNLDEIEEEEDEKNAITGQNGLSNDDYVDFTIPWTLFLNYSINFNNSFVTAIDPATELNYLKDTLILTQAISFSGDLSLTPNWKIGFNSGFDVVNEEFTFTQINVYRDLGCWEARFDVVPFGPRKSYSIGINLKNPLLSDLKIQRRRTWIDQQFF